MLDTNPAGLSEDQLAIVEAIRDFAETELAPHAIEWDETHHFPVDVIRRGGELGLGGIYAREDVGGSDLSRLDAALIFEELSRADPTIAAYISIHNMVVWMIDSYGTDAQRKQWLPPLTSMEQLASYCLTEPDAGSDAAALKTSARLDGEHYVLNGTKQFISGAGTSGVYVVMARTGGAGPSGISAFIVPADAEGLSFGPEEKKMGWKAQPTRPVIMENVRVPAENLLGTEGGGFRIAMKGLNGGRVNIGACSLGGAQWALDKSVVHLQQRVAFGKPLAEQQALVFALAEMQMRLQSARLMLHRAAAAIDSKHPDVATLCAMGKCAATDAGFYVANEALQLHGGYGYLADYGIEKIVRDLRVHQILEGTNEIMRMIVGRDLLAKAGASHGHPRVH